MTSNEPRTNSSLFTATSAALAISNLIHRFSSSYSANFAPPFLNYYIFTATIMHIFNRSMYPLLFSQDALTHCTDCCRMMSSIWSSAARTLHIIQGVDQKVETTMLVESSSSSSSSSSLTTAMAERGGGGGEGGDSSSFNAGWPSETPDSDWLSLETTWRMDSQPPEDMMCLTYFHAGQT